MQAQKQHFLLVQKYLSAQHCAHVLKNLNKLNSFPGKCKLLKCDTGKNNNLK